MVRNPFQKGYLITNFPTQYKGSAGIPLTSDEEILKSVNLNVSRMLAGTGDMSYGFITLVHAIFGTRDIDDKMREIIGLRTAKLLKTPYQWQQHATMGKNAGLTPEEIEAMTIDGPVSGISDDYMLLAQATDELTMDAVLTDACLTSLQRRYGNEVTRKLVLIIAFFNFLSRFLNGCRVPLETTEKMGNRTNPL